MELHERLELIKGELDAARIQLNQVAIVGLIHGTVVHRRLELSVSQIDKATVALNKVIDDLLNAEVDEPLTWQEQLAAVEYENAFSPCMVLIGAGWKCSPM